MKISYLCRCRHDYGLRTSLAEGSQGTDVDCHSFYQTFRPNLGPSSVVDQGTGHGDLYTQIRGRGRREKGMGGNTGGCVCVYKTCKVWG